MKSLNFRDYWEATDIFGFEKDVPKEEPFDNFSHEPINQFDVELMMDFLAKKKVGTFRPQRQFMNEIRWGGQPGAIKLEVDTGYTFHIKKLATDKLGNPRWVTKRMFQLNRQGYGGYEDSVAQEIYEHIKNYADGNIPAPKEEYDDLENLVANIYSKVRRTCKDMFIPEGVKKLHENAYVITFGVKASGLEARSQQRVEQNQTLVSYDREQGVIRITNYNLQSPTGGSHEFRIMPNELDLYFMPTQERDEISECLAVHMKYF